MKRTPDEDKRSALAIREIVARFVEEANADSVVVMWTSNSKIGTKAKITTWGNQFAIRDMIKTASDDYCIERINAIKLKIDKKPKPKDEPLQNKILEIRTLSAARSKCSSSSC